MRACSAACSSAISAAAASASTGAGSGIRLLAVLVPVPALVRIRLRRRHARSASIRRSMSGDALIRAWIMFSKPPTSWLRTSQSTPVNISTNSARCSRTDHR
jgi:hypothetical protein